MNFFQNTCKPNGFGGKLMVRMMNRGHRQLAEWGFSKLTVGDDLEILDAGCGGGANVALWLKRCKNSHVTGLDYSEISVAEAKKVNDAEIRKERCKIIQGNVAEMPFSEGQFNCVSAFETIYFWPDIKKCFLEVNRILKNGGTFMICNESDGTNTADDKWTKMIDGMHIYNEKQIMDCLREANFSSVESYADHKKHWLCIVAKK